MMSPAISLTIAKRASRPPRPFARSLPILGSLALSVALGACSKGAAATEKNGAPKANVDTSSAAVLATIGDEKITYATLHERAGERLDMLDGQYQRTRDKLIASALDSLVRERLLADEAKKKGKTVDELIAAEGGGTEPTPIEIENWFKENQARVGGRTLDQVSSQIADLLRNQRRKDASDKLEQRLRAERKVTVNFEPHRLQFANEGAPTKGKKDAPVTLVEFSDFQCPYCQAVAPVLKQVADKYGDKVQIIYRQFPIPSLHPFALKAAEASLCANEQGKFWEMHDTMFADQKKLAVSDLKETAGRLGMDRKKFDKCLDTGRYTEQVQNDQKEGQRVGINGTPAMFINGTYVEGGSVPYSTLSSLLDKELARVGTTR
jgi:protein-disulfide isomerase